MGRSAPPVSVGRVKAQANDGAPEQQQTVPMDWMVINNDFLCSGFRHLSRRDGSEALNIALTRRERVRHRLDAKNFAKIFRFSVTSNL
jgi:hypothetical protein